MDPIHQFQIKNILTFGRIGGVDIALTNSALFMFIALLLISLLMLGATSQRALAGDRGDVLRVRRHYVAQHRGL